MSENCLSTQSNGMVEHFHHSLKSSLHADVIDTTLTNFEMSYSENEDKFSSGVYFLLDVPELSLAPCNTFGIILGIIVRGCWWC